MIADETGPSARRAAKAATLGIRDYRTPFRRQDSQVPGDITRRAITRKAALWMSKGRSAGFRQHGASPRTSLFIEYPAQERPLTQRIRLMA
jgi:hypothetical protein